MSLEKEVFPYMANEGELFAFDLKGTYMYFDLVHTYTEEVGSTCG